MHRQDLLDLAFRKGEDSVARYLRKYYNSFEIGRGEYVAQSLGHKEFHHYKKNYMSLSLTDYRSKLITKIMFSNSQEEVKRYIISATKSLEKHKLNGHLITQFVDKTMDELAMFVPMNKDSHQWSNIQMAKIQFTRIKAQIKTMPD